MSNDMQEIKIQLAEISGGVRLIDSKLDHSNRIHDERHEKVREDIFDLKERVSANASDISGIKTWQSSFEGERKGVQISSKVIWTVATVLIGLCIAAITLASRLI